MNLDVYHLMMKVAPKQSLPFQVDKCPNVHANANADWRKNRQTVFLSKRHKRF